MATRAAAFLLSASLCLSSALLLSPSLAPLPSPAAFLSWNATHGVPRSLQATAGCGPNFFNPGSSSISPVEAVNQQWNFSQTVNDGQTSIPSSFVISCNGPSRGGFSYDLIIRPRITDRMIIYPALADFLAPQTVPRSFIQLGPNQPRAGPEGAQREGRPYLPIVIENGPCPSNGFQNPCGVLVQCHGANADNTPANARCQISYDILWYLQMSPFFISSPDNTFVNAQFPTVIPAPGTPGLPTTPNFVTGYTATFLRDTTSASAPATSPTGWQNDVAILNPNQVKLSVYAASGPSCALQPWDPAFAPDEDVEETRAVLFERTFFCPPGAGQCCTIVKCHRDNWGTGCPGLLYNGRITQAQPSPTPSPSPMSTPAPERLSTCGGESALAVPTLALGGAPVSAFCVEPPGVVPPVAAHSLQLANPNNHVLNVYFASGASCFANPLSAAFSDLPELRKTATTAASVVVLDIPCTATPCCSIVTCPPANAAPGCSSLTLTQNYFGATASPSPTASGTPSPTPAASASNTPSITPSATPSLTAGASPSNTPSTSFSSTASAMTSSASPSPTPTPTGTPTPGTVAGCAFPVGTAIGGLLAGAAATTACQVLNGSLTVSLQNPNGHRLALFFASGASCTAGLDSPTFASRPAFDQPDTVQTALGASGVPCDQPPCCFIVRCSATNNALPDGTACKGLTFGAAFTAAGSGGGGGGGAAAAPASADSSLPIPAVAGISVSAVMLAAGIALGVYAARAGCGCCSKQPAQGGSGGVVLNPAAAVAAASLNGTPAYAASGLPGAAGAVPAWGERQGGLP